MYRLIFLFLSFTLLSFPAKAVTGNEYQRLSNLQKTNWSAGVTDGILAVYALEDYKQTHSFAKCFGELERTQIQSIFKKSLKKQPERWQFPASFIFYETFKKHCGINN